MMQLEDLPKECFNQVCVCLSIPDVNLLSRSSTTFQRLVHKENSELWNLLLCQRLWTVDPCSLLDEHVVYWKGAFRQLVQAERDHQLQLDALRRLDLNGWLERHFIGKFSHWHGWERRYWSWDGNAIFAWSDASRTHCYAQFPVSADSAARRVSTDEQVQLGQLMDGGRNPVTTPKPFVFTIENTSFDLLFACESEDQLQLWLDKISVTLHPLKHGGKTYKAPAKYMLQKKKKRKRAMKEEKDQHAFSSC
jgi:hypothetical protein